jgi:hypothetical protein
MAWHKPRFTLLHLALLVCVVAVELAVMPAPWSCGMAGFRAACALLGAHVGPLKTDEWIGVVAIHLFLIFLVEPSTRHSHCPTTRPASSSTAWPSPTKH